MKHLDFIIKKSFTDKKKIQKLASLFTLG